MPKLSIIIPIYKTEKFLHRCLTSIQQQTFSDFEALLINDGSPDDSESICLEFCNSDKRFRYFKKENGGLGSARNLGLSNCNGAYIGFVDSDDEIGIDFYQDLIHSADTTQADIVISGYIRIESQKQFRYPSSKDLPPRRILTQEEISEYCILPFFGKTHSTPIPEKLSSCCDKLYLHQFIKGHTFVSEREYLSEDDLFNLHAYTRFPKVIFTASYGYSYYAQENSLTSKYSAKDVTRSIAYIQYLDSHFTSSDRMNRRQLLGTLAFFTLTSLLLRSNPLHTYSSIQQIMDAETVINLIQQAPRRKNTMQNLLKEAFSKQKKTTIWAYISCYWLFKSLFKAIIPSPKY